MFRMKPKAAVDLSALSDDALQERLAAAKRREKWHGRLETLLLCALCLGGIAAGGALGASLGGPVFALIMGGLGMGVVACVAENIPASPKSHSPVGICEREVTRRSSVLAAAEELASKPLAPHAAEDFIASAHSGTKETVTVSKPLRLKARNSLPDFPGRILK